MNLKEIRYNFNERKSDHKSSANRCPLPQSVLKWHRVLLLDHHPSHSGSCCLWDHSQIKRNSEPETQSPLQHILVLVHPPPHQGPTTKTTATYRSPAAASTCQFIICHSLDEKNANNLQLLLLLFPLVDITYYFLLPFISRSSIPPGKLPTATDNVLHQGKRSTAKKTSLLIRRSLVILSNEAVLLVCF